MAVVGCSAMLAIASLGISGCVAPPNEEQGYTAEVLELPDVTPRLSEEFFRAEPSSPDAATAGQSLAEELETLGSGIAPEECVSLLLFRPLRLSDDSSDDPVRSVDAWRSEVGSAFESHVRLFDSPSDASALLQARDTDVERCAVGYAGDDFRALSVERIAAELVRDQSLAVPGAEVSIVTWRELGSVTGDGGGDDYTFLGADLRRGNVVVRGNCLLLSIDREFEESCFSYFSSLVQRLEAIDVSP